MSRFQNEPEFSHHTPPRLGILLCNLGTPDSPETGAVRRYLAEFLRDRRVVEIPRLLWLAILHGIILRTRPKRSAEAYRKVWRDDGSPLLVFTRRQAEALVPVLESRLAGPLCVHFAMRYGNPSVAAVLEKMRQENVRRLLVLPMYPQYSGSTTASTLDAVSDVMRRRRWVPDFRFIAQYHDAPGYIAALAASIEAHWAAEGRGEVLLFSFHGIPRAYLDNGDPYHCQCLKTARLVAERLELADDAWQVSFQSRLGRAEWLRPYTDHVIAELADQGIRTVDAICAGFSADCLETLEEMVMQYGDLFRTHGGEALRYIPALNDSPPHIEFLADLICEQVQGWPESVTGSRPQLQAGLDASAERARAAGSNR